MAVRVPVYIDGNGNVRQMSTAQIDAWIEYVPYMYADGAYVTTLLAVVTDGTGNIIGNGTESMTDSRDDESAAVSGVSSYPTPAATTDAVSHVTYRRLKQSVIATPPAPTDTSSRAFPCYLDGSNDIRAMTLTDFQDTFIKPGIDLLVSGNDWEGVYQIRGSTTSTGDAVAGLTKINATPVFVDTQFDKSVHGGVEVTTNVEMLPFAGDTGTTINYYHLYLRPKGTVARPNPRPIKVDANGNVTQYTDADIDAVIGEGVSHAASGGLTGYGIRYHVSSGGTGTYPISNLAVSAYDGGYNDTPGTAMVDTTLNASVIIQDNDGADTYRAQRFPTGASEVETSYTLKIYRS